MPHTSASQPEIILPAIAPKQEQILQGAIRVFLQEGYARTSMDRVIPFRFKIDTNRRQGSREQGAGGKELEIYHLYQIFREMV